MSPPDRATPVAEQPAMALRAASYTGRLRRLSGSWVPAALIVLMLLGVWEGYVRLWEVPKWLLPAPSVIAMTLVVSRELLLDHTLVTLLEVVVGFGLALLCGVLLAVWRCRGPWNGPSTHSSLPCRWSRSSWSRRCCSSGWDMA